MVTQDERFDRLDASIERIDARMARTDASIERIDARMARTDALIERMDARMERTDVLIERMDARMERMDARMERMDASIERFSQHTDDRFDSLTKYILDLRDETSTRLRAIESRLDLQAVALTSMDARESRVPALTKAVLDAGSFSGQLAMELSKQRDSAFNFALRLEKLEDTVAKLLKPAA